MTIKNGASREGPERFLPLQHLTFHILVALAEEPRYGYDIGHEIEERSGGHIEPSIGSLYLAIQRLQEQGLVEETPDRPQGVREDARRRYYIATDAGRRVAAAEAKRLASLLDMARERNLLEP
jgi:DNA-binding PadR family transcriptional regulator